jgi:hypothetical protein
VTAPREAPGPAALLLGLAAQRLAPHAPGAGLEALAAAAGPGAEGRLMALLEGGAGAFAGLARAARLSAFDLDLLGLAVLPALDDRAADAVEALARGGRRLTAARAARLVLPPLAETGALRRALRESPLWRAGLLLGDAALPPAERPLAPSPALLAALDDALPEATAGGWALEVLAPPADASESLAPALATLLRWAAGEGPPLLLLAAARRARASEALARAAAALARPALLLHPPPTAPDAPPAPPPWAEAGVLAAAAGALVGLVAEGGTLAGPVLPPLAPLAVLGADAVTGTRVALGRLAIPPPGLAEQRARWAAALPEAPAGALAAQGWAGPDEIAALAAGAPAPTPEGLLAARLAVAPPRAPRQAVLRAPAVPWERLVLDAATTARLEELVGRVAHRATVRGDWGMAAGGQGVVALLSGDPGTGKTMAAEAVALRLGLPMLSVDLSRLVSKWIGETEKNLAELFEAAEGFGALLFFDEADALFGKRGEVNEAQDRYANMEVSYLLQRLERFEGIALLATNLAQGMDEAFLRRFDLIIRVPRPAPAQRRRLWEALLPEAVRAPGLDLAGFARRFDVTGAEIRNAALAAAYAAAAEGGAVTAERLRAALAMEFAKQGRPLPGEG